MGELWGSGFDYRRGGKFLGFLNQKTVLNIFQIIQGVYKLFSLLLMMEQIALDRHDLLHDATVNTVQ